MIINGTSGIFREEVRLAILDILDEPRITLPGSHATILPDNIFVDQGEISVEFNSGYFSFMGATVLTLDELDDYGLGDFYGRGYDGHQELLGMISNELDDAGYRTEKTQRSSILGINSIRNVKTIELGQESLDRFTENLRTAVKEILHSIGLRELKKAYPARTMAHILTGKLQEFRIRVPAGGFGMIGWIMDSVPNAYDGEYLIYGPSGISDLYTNLRENMYRDGLGDAMDMARSIAESLLLPM